jgi:hypothetical protein
VAAERKLRVDPQVWQEIADHFIAVQDKEGEEVQVRPIFRTQPGAEKEGGKRSRLPQGQGQTPAQGKTVARKSGTTGSEGVKVRARGWKYLSDEQELAGIQGRRRQFSMVCAGLSSLLLAQRNLPPASHSDALKAALRDGFGWLSRFLDGNRRPGRDFYAFYSLEKVGDIGEVTAFGDFDWYAECAQVVIRSQRPDGGWRDEIKTDEASARAATCLALLFLDRATDLGARSRPLVVTRAGGGDQPVTDRGYWVYLPSLKGDVSAARLFRLLRYRPGKQVLKLAEEAVKVHDRERTADIVRPLAATVRLSPYDNVKAVAKRLLVQAAGVEFDDPKLYEEWALRLEEVVRIGKASDKAQTERLREMLSGSDGPVLKARVAWALQRVGDKGSLGALIELLEDKDPAMREAAYQTVTFLSGKSLPFHPKGSEKQRVDEVQAWRVWLAGEKAVAPSKEPEAPPSKPPDSDS